MHQRPNYDHTVREGYRLAFREGRETYERHVISDIASALYRRRGLWQGVFATEND